jgi:hypothetical protein
MNLRKRFVAAGSGRWWSMVCGTAALACSALSLDDARSPVAACLIGPALADLSALVDRNLRDEDAWVIGSRSLARP